MPDPDLNKIASSLAAEPDVIGKLMLANANGLTLRDTFAVHALVLSNKILRAPLPEDGAYNRADAAAVIRPDAKPDTATAVIG